MRRILLLLWAVFFVFMDAIPLSSRRSKVNSDFVYEYRVGHLYLSYFHKNKEIYDNFPTDGWVKLEFYRDKNGDGNTLKIKYQLDKFGERTIIKFVHNVVVYTWGEDGLVNCSIEDTNRNGIIGIIPWGDPEDKCDVWMWNEWIITDK